MEVLRAAVQEMFGSDAASAVAPGNVVAAALPGTGGGSFASVVQRLTGADERSAWSVVTKRILAEPNRAGWDREVMALGDRTWLLDQLPSGLTAPRVLGVVREFDAVTVIMEDLAGGRRRDRAFYATASRLLTQFSVHATAQRPWWSHGFIDDEFRTLSDHPDRVARTTSGSHELTQRLREQIRALLELGPSLLAETSSLPHGPGHLDAFSRNLIGDGIDGSIGLIDWATAGSAPVGADPATLFVLSTNYLDTEGPIDELEASIIAGMLDGLDGSSHATSDALRGFHLIARLRHLAMMMNALPMVERGDPAVSLIVGRPLDQIVERWVDLGEHLLGSASPASVA